MRCAQVAGGRPFQHRAVRREPRPMQRAFPGLVGVVPVHDPAQMGAHRRDAVLGAVDAASGLQAPRRSADHAALVLAGIAVAGSGRRGDPALDQVEADLEIGLQRGRQPGQLVRAPACERARPVHPATQDAAGEGQRRRGPVRHPPLAETRCDKDAFVIRQDRADVRQIVDGRVVLRRPEMGLHRSRVVQARPRRKLVQRLRRTPFAAHGVAGAAHDQPFAVGDRRVAHGTRR